MIHAGFLYPRRRAREMEMQEHFHCRAGELIVALSYFYTSKAGSLVLPRRLDAGVLSYIYATIICHRLELARKHMRSMRKDSLAASLTSTYLCDTF
jgi:hypothetical protein